jgi:hypothetical protein
MSNFHDYFSVLLLWLLNAEVLQFLAGCHPYETYLPHIARSFNVCVQATYTDSPSEI